MRRREEHAWALPVGLLQKPLHLHGGVHRFPRDASCRYTVNDATQFATCLIVTTGAIQAEMRNIQAARPLFYERTLRATWVG